MAALIISFKSLIPLFSISYWREGFEILLQMNIYVFTACIPSFDGLLMCRTTCFFVRMEKLKTSDYGGLFI